MNEPSGVQVVIGITDDGNVVINGTRFKDGGMGQMGIHESIALALRAVHFWHLQEMQATQEAGHKPQILLATGGMN